MDLGWVREGVGRVLLAIGLVSWSSQKQGERFITGDLRKYLTWWQRPEFDIFNHQRYLLLYCWCGDTKALVFSWQFWLFMIFSSSSSTSSSRTFPSTWPWDEDRGENLVVIWGWCDVYWECCDGDMTRDRLRSDKSDHEEPAVYWVWRDNVPLLASHGANQCGHCIPVARGGWKLNYLQTDTEIDISLCWSAGPDSNIKAVENILSNLFKHLCSVLRSILLF